jgi:hypothetical protein
MHKPVRVRVRVRVGEFFSGTLAPAPHLPSPSHAMSGQLFHQNIEEDTNDAADRARTNDIRMSQLFIAYESAAINQMQYENWNIYCAREK